jgi:hypothetical protein
MRNIYNANHIAYQYNLSIIINIKELDMALKREKKVKSKSDYTYPQFCFRIPENKADQFEKVQNKIEELYEYYKSTQGEDEKTIKRNEIIIEALDLGLKELKKRK